MMSCGKWAPLKLIAIVSLPYDAPFVMKGDHTANGLKCNFATKPALSPRALWGWGHAAGQRAMEQLQEQWQAVAQGQLPPEEPLAPELVAAPLLLGADGVMVPFRPAGG